MASMHAPRSRRTGYHSQRSHRCDAPPRARPRSRSPPPRPYQRPLPRDRSPRPYRSGPARGQVNYLRNDHRSDRADRHKYRQLPPSSRNNGSHFANSTRVKHDKQSAAQNLNYQAFITMKAALNDTQRAARLAHEESRHNTAEMAKYSLELVGQIQKGHQQQTFVGPMSGYQYPPVQMPPYTAPLLQRPMPPVSIPNTKLFQADAQTLDPEYLSWMRNQDRNSVTSPMSSTTGFAERLQDMHLDPYSIQGSSSTV